MDQINFEMLHISKLSFCRKCDLRQNPRHVVARCAVPAARTAEAHPLFPRSTNGLKRYLFKSYFTTQYYYLSIVKLANYAALRYAIFFT